MLRVVTGACCSVSFKVKMGKELKEKRVRVRSWGGERNPSGWPVR